MEVDTLIDARWIIPVEPAGTVLTESSLVIDRGSIRDLLPTAAAHQRYAAREHLKLTRHALIPGLINLHTHAAMSLMRGLADDVSLMEWLNHHIWPAERQHVSDEFVFDGTLLACAEMLRGGVTCFNDMYYFPEAAARAALAAHMRATLGIVVIDFPSAYASDAQDYLSKGLATRDELRHEPLLDFCLAPHAPYTVSDASFSHLLTYAEQLDLTIHMHVHETAHEVAESVSRFGMRPLARLHRLGLLGPRFIAVHAVHLDDAEIARLVEHGSHVAHCPSSNLKLASGIAPIHALTQAGVNVGLGTDGAASNNRLDVWSEMRLAALLAKAASGSAESMPAEQALAMATINAARALGLDEKIGSLTVGKCADIVAVDLSAAELAPCYDPVSHLVYAAGREHVSHVWVNGKLLLDDGASTVLDSEELKAKANLWRKRISPLAA
ncbi:MAG: TRZ/ATZ family hydrolase [Burkholderiales bacterium]|nr:TRZ/ATZ family hydrolase [Burkholderiales bacterium]